MSLRRLRATRAYLAGAMDFAPDGGVQWRRKMTEWLHARGVIVLDPTCKPIDIGFEKIEDINYRHELLAKGDYDTICREMKIVRCTDLRMVDLSDFLVVNIDISVYTTGTIEEMTTANRSKKPIVVHCVQGKQACPQWIFAMIGHHTVFSTWGEVYKYLYDVDFSGQNDKRWYFFDFKIPPEALT